MKRLLPALLLSLFVAVSHAQTPSFEWVQGLEIIGTNLSGSRCEDVTVDGQGNVISIGYFKGNNTDFDTDPTFGVHSYLHAGNSQSGYVQKLDSDGNYVWAVNFENTDLYNRAYSLDVDAAGNIYCTGFFQGTVDFEPGTGVTELTSAGGADAFIVKLNSDGTLGWAKQFTGDGDVLAYSVVLDSSGNITLAGVFEGTTDFDPSAGVSNVTSISYSDMFLAKLNAAGDLIWVKQIGSTVPGSGHEEELEHTVDDNGNVLMTGFFHSTLDFDPSPNTFELTNASGTDLFILKLDANGDFVWAKQVGENTSGTVMGRGIDTDAAGNVYVAGRFTNYQDFDPGPGLAQIPGNSTDAFTLKLDANGNFVWVREIVGADEESASGIAVAPDGTSYTVGAFNGSPDFDNSLGTFTLSAQSSVSADAYILKLDADGNFVWAGDFGSSSGEAGYAIHLDGNESIYAIGFYSDPVDPIYPEMDFDPGPGEATIYSTSSDPQGFFTLKLSQNSSPVGIDSGEEETGLIVFPNPSTGNILVLTDATSESTLNIYDMKGKLVHSERVSSSSVDLSLPEQKGIYLLRVETDKAVYSGKIIHQ